jgi:hypothetical protein
MGIAFSLVLVAVGAILRFAVTVTAKGFNLNTIGVILIIIGGVAFLVSLAFWSSWGGFGGSSRRGQTTVSGPQGTTTTRTEEHVG